MIQTIELYHVNHSQIVLTYKAGILTNIDLEHSDVFAFMDLNRIVQYDYVNMIEILKATSDTWTFNSKNEIPANIKIAIWCDLYQAKYNDKYRVTKAEAKMLQSVEVTQELVQVFFTLNEWWSKIKSISVYVKYYNEIKRFASGSTGKTQGGSDALAKAFQRRYNSQNPK